MASDAMGRAKMTSLLHLDSDVRNTFVQHNKIAINTGKHHLNGRTLEFHPQT